MTTTETTASQPKSIGDDAQFYSLLRQYVRSCNNGWMSDAEVDSDKALLAAYVDNLIDSRAPAAQASATIQFLHNVCADVLLALRNCDRQPLADLLEAALGGLPVSATIQAALGEAEIRNAALEEAAKMLLNGSFLHDKAPPKIFADQAAKAIREMKRAATIQEPVMVAEPAGDIAGCECLKDVVSHHGDFHMACQTTRDLHLRSNDPDSAAYWDKQINVLARMKVQAEAALAAPMVAEPAAAQFKMPGETWEECSIDEEDSMRARDYKFRYLYTHAAPMVADPAGVAEPGEIDLIALLENCKPNYGDVGSRDIDVTSKRIAIDEAIRRLRIAGPQFTAAKYLAATVKAVPSEALDEVCNECCGFGSYGDGYGAIVCAVCKGSGRTKIAAPLADKTGGTQ